MSWKETLQLNGAQWAALMEYVDERIAMHTQVCLDPERSELAIRQSQCALTELRALQSLPTTLRAEAQIRAQSGHRKGY